MRAAVWKHSCSSDISDVQQFGPWFQTQIWGCEQRLWQRTARALKANSHIPCRVRSMPRSCRSESDFSKPRHSAACAWHGMCELASVVLRRHVGDLPAFDFFRLPHRVPRRLLSEAYQSAKLKDYHFGYFRLPRGLSRSSWHCRRMAGMRHCMCELTRHGMAGERHGMCELAFRVS
jgi:hypothetical protein